jgi:long-chain acyl-CoA synthetase
VTSPLNTAIDPAALRRVIVSIVADELATFRSKPVPVHEAMGWPDDLTLNENGIGFDSLGMLNVAARANQFFHLHEVGIEDYLLMEPTLGKWQAIISKALELSFVRLTFQTSGSTGTPKPCTQERQWLEADAAAIGKVLQDPKRILSLVPPHHIYGFIYSALMPAILQVPVLDIRHLSPGALVQLMQAGDVIIATPHLWRYLVTSISEFPNQICGLTSTAAMPQQLAHDLRAAGLYQLIEIYGSTETNGIGWRDQNTSGFSLFDWWRKSDRASVLLRQGTGADSEEFELMDTLLFDDDGTFQPAGRVDRAVQVGGMNVFPDHIASQLSLVEGVVACAVRPFSPSGDVSIQRLKAFVVPAVNVSVVDLEQALRLHATATFATSERPVSYTFGPALPMSQIGKNADWEV